MSANTIIHKTAIIEDSVSIGSDTSIGAHVHIMSNAIIGSSCNICDCAYIDCKVIIGNRVIIKNGVQLYNGITIEDDVFIGPNVTFCNDRFPRSKQHLSSYPSILIKKGASIGANATILPGITIGMEAMVGAGAVVTHNVPDQTVVVGNPARHLRYLSLPDSNNAANKTTNLTEIKTNNAAHCEMLGVRLIELPEFVDRRGKLSFAQYESHLPWKPLRYFIIYDTPENELRGYHAHKKVSQFFVCLQGSVRVLLDNGTKRQEVILNKPTVGLLIKPYIWSSQLYQEKGSMLLVLSPNKHDPVGYIHDYATFKQEVESMELKDKSEKPVRVPFLNIKAFTDLVRKPLEDAFHRVLDSGCFVLGPEVEAFENEFAKFCGAKYCVGLGSGLAALHLMLLAADIGNDDEVIVASNSYIATVLAVTAVGAKPIFVEPNGNTYNLDATNIKDAITNKTKAILTTDLYGQPSDIDALVQVANDSDHNILVFCDCAQSHGAKYKKFYTGSVPGCVASAFSFYPSKNLGALGEAGAVVTNSLQIADKIRMLRNYGSKVRYHNELKGVNERMDPMQAAFLRCKLPYLAELNHKRTITANTYIKAFKSLKWMTVPYVPEWAQPTWHLFVIQCPSKIIRDNLQSFLKDHNIDSLIHYPIPPHLSEAYADLGYTKGSFPIAEELAEKVLSLPICPFMSELQTNAVINCIHKFDQQIHT